MEQPSFSAYHFDEFRLDLNRCCLLDGAGREIELTPREFELLKYLCQHERELINKETLIKEVWQIPVEEGIVKGYISGIRKKLGDKGKTIIYTRHGYGYRFDCDVEKLLGGSDGEKGAAVVDAPDEVAPLQEPGAAVGGDLPDASRTAPFSVAATTPAPSPYGHEIEEGRGSTAPAREDSRAASDDRDETFEVWLSRPGRWLPLILLCCIVTTIVLSIGVAFGGAQPAPVANARAMQVASGAQCLVILLMFLHSLFWSGARGFRPSVECGEADIIKAGFKSRAEFEDEREGLESNLRNHVRYWRGLLLSWVPLYLVYTLGEFPGHEVLLVVLNLVNTVMLGLCFNSLNKNVDEQDQEHMAGGFLNGAMLMLLVGALVVLLWMRDLRGATLLTGITAGITMALYIGRLQSRFIGPRFWILYLLYSYTAIQPLVLYIQDNRGWGVIVLDFALVLKCLLYIYMTWLFQSGLLLFYFAGVRRTDSALREQPRAFRKLL